MNTPPAITAISRLLCSKWFITQPNPSDWVTSKGYFPGING